MDTDKLKRNLETKYHISLDFIIDTQGLQCLVRNGVVTERIKVTDDKPQDKVAFSKLVDKFLVYDLENYLLCRGGRVSIHHKHKLVPPSEIERMSKRDGLLSFRAYPKRCKNDRMKFKWLNLQLSRGIITPPIFFDLVAELNLDEVK